MASIDPSIDPMRILTPREVADYLQVSEQIVRTLIAAHDIPSFDVAGEPRIQAGALLVWFQDQVRLKDFEKLRRTIADKGSWSAALREEPGLRREIRASK